MTRKYLRSIATLTAIVGAATCIAITPADAASGEVDAGGMHVVAAVDMNNVVPAGGDIATGIPFVHAVKVSGNYSVSVDGVSSVRDGEIAIGYLVGCAVDISQGVSIGIAPSVGVSAGIAPELALTLGDSPSVTVAISPNVGVNASLTGAITVSLAPGNVTAVVIGAASLDQDVTFPYTFGHTNTPLNISGCISPASAMPFVTVRADGTGGTAQTTGYGTEFTF
ncbi:MspA family porin [Nocardia sp. NPDC050408]|uniref:MspA family porin n=1 Tax=Nocardia sp. NPDC050408 TaxID=3364319 RepID=UPI0037B0961B